MRLTWSDAAMLGARVAVLLTAVFVLLLTTGALQPVELITPGGRGPSAALVREDFGADAVPEDKTGYDGQQFYAVARDFPDLEAAAEHLDAPRYRLLRIAVPAIASVGGQGTPVVVIILAVNILGTALACGSLAALCDDRGWPPSLGYLAAVPVLFGVIGSTADPISLGLGLAGLLAASRGRHGAAITVLVIAALTREQVAAMGLGVAAGLFLSGDRRPVLLGYLLPIGAVVGWYVALGELVGGELPDRFDVLAMFSTGTDGLVIGTAALALSLWGAWTWREVPVVWPVALGFGLWTLVYFRGTFDLAALPRTTAPSLVFGLTAAADRLGIPAPRAEPAPAPDSAAG